MLDNSDVRVVIGRLAVISFAYVAGAGMAKANLAFVGFCVIVTTDGASALQQIVTVVIIVNSQNDSLRQSHNPSYVNSVVFVLTDGWAAFSHAVLLVFVMHLAKP